MSSAKRESFISSFTICMFFYVFFLAILHWLGPPMGGDKSDKGGNKSDKKDVLAMF